MKTPRKLLTSAFLAVAFLSAGAFAQTADTGFSQSTGNSASNVTVIAKTPDTSFAL